jgi:Na+/melibiose symporter-like transporter
MKLDYKKTFYIGLAFFLITLFWQTYDSIIAKILIDKFGLNQTWSGVVMALDNVLALFLIPLFGSLSDKKQSKKGKRTPYIIVGTIVAAFAFMTLSFTDNLQTTKIENNTDIVEQYNAYEENINYGTTPLDYDGWVLMSSSIVSQWDDLLDSETITQEKYDVFYQNVINGLDTGVKTEDEMDESKDAYVNDRREGIDEILLMSEGTLDENDIMELEDFYYSHLNNIAWIQTTHSPAVFIVFVINLLVALLAMATFRSPAVSLMPDVTIKPLRSKGNAVINLLGTFGGILAIVILKIYGLDNLSYVNYTPAFITVGILMLVILGLFLWKVKENKVVKEREQLEIKLGLDKEDELEADEQNETVEELSKDKRKSLILILLSVFLWFTGYNAVTTKLSDYAPKVLHMGYAMPLLIAQGAALIAFIPIGILATKIGRRKTVLIGIVLLTVCFGSVYFLTVDTASIMFIVFGLTGVGWATINVNSYPMVVELAKGKDVGKYTGYYYTFSMAAQILTPILSGVIMDFLYISPSLQGRRLLFPYAALFVAASFITMMLVKHGDAKIIGKASVLENFDVDMD